MMILEMAELRLLIAILIGTIEDNIVTYKQSLPTPPAQVHTTKYQNNKKINLQICNMAWI